MKVLFFTLFYTSDRAEQLKVWLETWANSFDSSNASSSLAESLKNSFLKLSEKNNCLKDLNLLETHTERLNNDNRLKDEINQLKINNENLLNKNIDTINRDPNLHVMFLNFQLFVALIQKDYQTAITYCESMLEIIPENTLQFALIKTCRLYAIRLNNFQQNKQLPMFQVDNHAVVVSHLLQNYINECRPSLGCQIESNERMELGTAYSSFAYLYRKARNPNNTQEQNREFLEQAMFFYNNASVATTESDYIVNIGDCDFHFNNWAISSSKSNNISHLYPAEQRLLERVDKITNELKRPNKIAAAYMTLDLEPQTSEPKVCTIKLNRNPLTSLIYHADICIKIAKKRFYGDASEYLRMADYSLNLAEKIVNPVDPLKNKELVKIALRRIWKELTDASERDIEKFEDLNASEKRFINEQRYKIHGLLKNSSIPERKQKVFYWKASIGPSSSLFFTEQKMPDFEEIKNTFQEESNITISL